jgi:hypothetical protein
MRTMFFLAVTTMLVLVAVGSWAVTSRSQVQPQHSGTAIFPLDLMMNAKDLPIRQYDAI